MILLDAAHNPHGAEAAAAALEDSFAFSPLIGVVGVMTDKDVEGVLAVFEPHLAQSCAPRTPPHRAMPAAELAVMAREVFGPDRVNHPASGRRHRRGRRARRGRGGDRLSIGTGAVLVTGSVVTVGEARAMLRRRGSQS